MYERSLRVCLRQDALRRDVFVTPSERWGDPRAKLLHGPGWDTVRTQVCRTLGRSEAAALELDRLTADLNEAYQRTAAGLPSNAAARIERTGGQDRLAQQWGGGEVALVDGVRFVVPVRTLNAGHNPKYFGVGRGVTY